MRPEAILGPKTVGRPHETMDKMDKGLPHQQIEVPKIITMYNEKIGSVTLHVFADALRKYPIPNCNGWSDSTKVLF